jgi:acyl carrier protein
MAWASIRGPGGHSVDYGRCGRGVVKRIGASARMTPCLRRDRALDSVAIAMVNSGPIAPDTGGRSSRSVAGGPSVDALQQTILSYVMSEYVQDQNQRIEVSTPLVSSGMIDSFSMVSLKRFLERSYGIAIPDRAATPEAFDSVERIAALVRQIKPDV